MKTFYSSTFISIVLAFLMIMGKNGQPIKIVQDLPEVDFKNLKEEKTDKIFEEINIEVFENLTCEKCTDFTNGTLAKIRELEKETNEVKVHLYFIPNINDPILDQAAMSLKCSGDQSQFWAMHQKIHDGRNDLNKKSFKSFSHELGMETDLFDNCMEENAHQKSIEEDIKYAAEKNITVQPTIFINQYKMIGNQPFENVQKIINQLRKEKKEKTMPKIPSTITPVPLEESVGSEESVRNNEQVEASEKSEGLSAMQESDSKIQYILKP